MLFGRVANKWLFSIWSLALPQSRKEEKNYVETKEGSWNSPNYFLYLDYFIATYSTVLNHKCTNKREYSYRATVFFFSFYVGANRKA